LRCKTITLILYAFVLVALLASSAFAIGISPPRVIADSMSRGTSAEKTVYLSGLNGGDEVIISIDEEIRDWISVDRGTEFIFPEGAKSIPIVFTITVPDDAANGQYSGGAVIRALASSSEDNGGASASVSAGVSISFSVDVTGDQVVDYSVTLVRIPDAEVDDPLQVVLTIKNNGNVQARPTMISIDVVDQFKNQRFSESISGMQNVPPHTTGKTIAAIPHTLPTGQYWADVEVFSKEGRIHSEKGIAFEVVNQGELNVLGELQSLSVPDEVGKEEIVRIEAVFRNIGERPVNAVLVSEIYKGKSLIKVLESDPVSVDFDEADNIISYFTPPRSGTYTVKGYVNYADKKTETMDAEFAVMDEGFLNPTVIGVVVLLFAIVGIAYFRIRRRFKE